MSLAKNQTSQLEKIQTYKLVDSQTCRVVGRYRTQGLSLGMLAEKHDIKSYYVLKGYNTLIGLNFSITIEGQ
jgi:hypothetical protein